MNVRITGHCVRNETVPGSSASAHLTEKLYVRPRSSRAENCPLTAAEGRVSWIRPQAKEADICSNGSSSSCSLNVLCWALGWTKCVLRQRILDRRERSLYANVRLHQELQPERTSKRYVYVSLYFSPFIST
jgi:hypothetical protein